MDQEQGERKGIKGRSIYATCPPPTQLSSQMEVRWDIREQEEEEEEEGEVLFCLGAYV